MSKLLCLSQSVLDSLRNNISLHIEQYRNGDFSLLERENGWRIELDSVDINYDLLNDLNNIDLNISGDLENSLKIFHSLEKITVLVKQNRTLFVETFQS